MVCPQEWRHIRIDATKYTGLSIVYIQEIVSSQQQMTIQALRFIGSLRVNLLVVAHTKGQSCGKSLHGVTSSDMKLNI